MTDVKYNESSKVKLIQLSAGEDSFEVPVVR